MRYLIDIGHPAHVHLFKHFAHEMSSRGHRVFFTCRSREFVTELLEHEGFAYTCLGRNYTTTAGKLWGLFRFTSLLFRVSRQFKPDLLLSHSSMYAAFTAFLLRRPHISFEDTFNFEQIRLYQPFTKAILTATYDHPLKSNKVVRYPGYHELAYLHPNRFTPDPSVLSELFLQSTSPKNSQSKLESASPSEEWVCEGGTTEAASRKLTFVAPPGNDYCSSINDCVCDPAQAGEAASTPNKFIILRFVSWSASHDIGHNGMTLGNKIAAVNSFSAHAKVFISAESPLPPLLEPYRFPLPPHRMHHAIAFASLVFGESATMASEAAMLGVPAIYLDNTGRLYTREQEEKYGLVFNYTESEQDQQRAIAKGVELLTTPGIKEKWHQKRARMLGEKIDVTEWLVDFVEEFYNKGRPG
ncbi:MAG: DUF354 domain-containing protein [Bacteroidales bacterium]|nr:DUF354 domain-containing protein [Bacteroidales bacterium]